MKGAVYSAMIELRTSREGEENQEKALWQQVFGDDDAFIQLYYDTCYTPKDVFVLLEDGRLASMLICLPVTLRMADKSMGRGAYVYALATAPASRGKGYAQKLLAFMHTHLRDQGLDFSATVPAMSSLFSFFQKAGFSPFFYHQENRYASEILQEAPGYAEICSAEQYQQYRMDFLPAQPSIIYPASQILWQKQISRLHRADLYRMTFGANIAYAAAEYLDAHTVMLKELLAPPSCAEEALAVLSKALPAQAYIVRTPVYDTEVSGASKAFGSIAVYNTSLAQETEHLTKGYLGLAFD